VPTTFVGLLLFVVLLAPGFAYVARREVQQPVRPTSIFRETVAVALASVGCDIAVVLVFAVVRWIGPGVTPDIGALVRQSGSYAEAHYVALAAWGLGLLAGACLLALALAGLDVGSRLARLLQRVPGLHWLAPPARTAVSPKSAWLRVFREYEDHAVHVGCHLDDGSYLSGWLLSYSPDYNETADRDLALSAPIEFRASGHDTACPLEGIGAVVISARRIVNLLVSYVPEAEARGADAPATNVNARPLPVKAIRARSQ